MDAANAVETDRLTKRYGRQTAVRDLSMAVPAGTVAGFIGPNGAGKTTTMGMLLGLVRPSAGSATVLGAPLGRPDAYLARVGASVERPGFYPGLSGHENLRVLATVGGHDSARIPELLDLVGLGRRGGDRFGGYSMGMKQRLAIAAALLGDPELLILDEPTNGLDPAAIHEMRTLIRGLAGGGRTVFVSSHQLSELEQMCDWLVVIDRGALQFQGPAADFGIETARVLVVPERVDDVARLRDRLAAGGLAAEPNGDVATLALAAPPAEARSVAAEVSRAAAAAGVVLVELRTERKNLEERYLAMVGGGAVEWTGDDR